MKKKISLLIGIYTLFTVSGFSQIVVLLEEGFETDGHGSRYTASSNGGFDANIGHVYFTRTDGENIVLYASGIPFANGEYTGFSGDYFWAAEDTDESPGDGSAEQVIVFNPINITGYNNLSFSGLFGAGNEQPTIGDAYDAGDYIQVTAQIDEGTETKVLCFAYENHGDSEDELFGLDANCDGTADNNGIDRLVTELTEYSANIPGTGNSLTIRIKVRVDGWDEEIAFDDITVTNTSVVLLPQPDSHPTSFMAAISGALQINLSWADATGTNLPTGYAIYANTTNTFTDPTDGIPPMTDENLSDDIAIVTVNHGSGGSYTFTGLKGSTTYYFKIWAYSNTGSGIDYLTSSAGPTASIATPALIFQEGFEDDGHGTRYTASSNGGSYVDPNAHFRRTDGTNISNTSGPYTGFSGTHFWATEETHSVGNGNPEQTIVFNPINIAEVYNLFVSGLFGAGNDATSGVGYDAGDYIRVSYQIDSETETDVLCFGVENHSGDTRNQPFGLDADCNGFADNNGVNRLGTKLTEYSADIPGAGTMLRIRIKVRVNGLKEEIAFDDITMVSLSPGPEPSEHPVAFTAKASVPGQIDLNWTDAKGTNVPAGYVIYANTTNTFTDPTDDISPMTDENLSDGIAIVTVNHGAGGSYTFTELILSTTYYFKIWAYSNGGSDIDYLTSMQGPTTSVANSIVFREGFETDGHTAGRYTASSNGGFYVDPNAHFRRTNGTDISNSSDAYTGFLGDYFWAAENIDEDAGDGNEEQTIVFNPINIAGVNNLSISGLFGAFNEQNDYDDYIRLSYQIDLGVETDVLCFGVENHNGNIVDGPFGLDADCNGFADNNGVNRLGTKLTEYSADIPETGDLLTVRIRVNADQVGEEIAFDDITVVSLPPRPEPSEQPVAFRAARSGTLQINLSWAEAAGTHLPTGYVIYASETNTLTAPVDGTPPMTDENLSDGTAVITVFQDVGSYTFTGLSASTTYYFQIWAYSNTGSDIDYLVPPAGPTASFTTRRVIFHEGFETDGPGSTYIGGDFYVNPDIHFRRTDGTDISNSSGSYTGFSDTHFWAAENIDEGGGNEEQTVIFNRIDIAGVNNLSISGFFGAGNGAPFLEFDRGYYDAGDYIRLSYQIDSGVETDVLCFAYEDHGDGLNEPFGLDADCDGIADNNGVTRLVPELTEYSANILETGDFLTLRIKVRVDGEEEEIAFDDIAVVSPPPEPEPSEQPSAFMISRGSLGRINLRWTDAAGTNVPTGYVIYASETNTLTAPADGTPPEIDTDLSDGNAVVITRYGLGPADYTFTGLTDSKTYYFQIWAFSNTGNDIDYLISTAGPTASVTLPTPISHEGFETDGHARKRYTANFSGDFYVNPNIHFRRTDGTDIFTSSGNYTGFSGTYFWAGEGISEGGEGREETIVFKPINIAGFNNLSISGLFGAGNDRTYDAGDYIRLSYKIDSGAETDVLCFAYEDHGDGLDEPFGLDANCDGTADSNNGANRLVPALTEYRSLIPETGTTLTLRIKVHVDGSGEEIAFDDIILGNLPPRPEPSEQPPAFTAVASSEASIHLSWTDAAGTHLPAGYVIYASETNTLTAPADGTPPEIDTDLSDGNAVVITRYGLGPADYTFTGLTDSKTYYFQIWAFSNTGNDIDYLISTAGPMASVTP